MVLVRDLSVCDNWGGTSLLDIGGKLFTKTIQSRLQDVVGGCCLTLSMGSGKEEALWI